MRGGTMSRMLCRAGRIAALATVLAVFPHVAESAVLTVGPAGSYATIQGAVDNATPGSVVDVSPGTYLESVDLSRMGIAIGGSPGDLTIRSVGGVVVVSSASGPAFRNASPYAGDLTLQGLSLSSTGVSAGAD